jgi:hypothetical protein
MKNKHAFITANLLASAGYWHLAILHLKSIRAIIMAKEIDVQQAELESFQLYALLKAVAFSSDELEPSETKALFELAYSLSVPVSCFMQGLEQEICNDGK